MFGFVIRLAVISLSATALFSSANESAPRIWIFNGLPGDEEHHQFFEKNLAAIRKAFTNRFQIPAENISILYGPKEAGYLNTASRENVLTELEKIVQHSQKPDASPVWIIFHGHANRIPGGANLNLPGPDLSSKDIARALHKFSTESTLVILATTAASSDFLRDLSGPGRIVIAANSPKDPVSEPDFPLGLSMALASAELDADKDNLVSVLELFRACKQQILSLYESQGYMVREHAQLDGNGDGRGTQRPASEDGDPASKVTLPIPQLSKFE